MKILLTGANGFLGSRLLEMLIVSHQVAVTLRKNSKIYRIKNILESKKINMIYTDIITDEELEVFFQTEKFDLIVHCATDYGKQKESFYKVFDSNVLFPLKLLEIGLKYGLKYFINTDSYFNKKHLTYNALPNYSKTKKLFLGYLKEIGNNIIILNMRLEHIYGPNDNDDKFIPFLFNKLINNEQISLTHGNQKRDLIYLDDVVDSYVKVISILEKIQRPYFHDLEIGSGKSIELREFIEIMKTTLKSTSILDYGAIDYRDDEIMNSYANDSLPNITLPYGIECSFRNVKQGIYEMLQIQQKVLKEKNAQ